MREMSLTFCCTWIAVAGLIPSIGFGQEVGSQQAYRLLIAGQQRAEEAELKKSREIGRLKSLKQLSHLENPTDWLSPDLPSKKLNLAALEPNQIGRVVNYQASVFDVIDDKTIYIHFTWNLAESQFILIENCPSTAKIADDDKISLPDYFKVTETRDFRGSKIFVMRMLDKTETLQLLGRDKQEETDRLKHEAELEAEREAAKLRNFRTWHSKSGTDVEGKFVRFRAQTVEVELKNGKKTTFRITALTDEDAEIVKRLAKEDLEAKKTSK